MIDLVDILFWIFQLKSVVRKRQRCFFKHLRITLSNVSFSGIAAFVQGLDDAAREQAAGASADQGCHRRHDDDYSCCCCWSEPCRREYNWCVAVVVVVAIQCFWPLTSCILRVHVECTCTCSYSVHEHVYTMLYIVDSYLLFVGRGCGVLVLVQTL